MTIDTTDIIFILIVFLIGFDLGFLAAWFFK
jgi:hypothetical protein